MNHHASDLKKVGQIVIVISVIVVFIGEVFGNSYSMILGGIGLLSGLIMIWRSRSSKRVIPPGALARSAFATRLAEVAGCQNLGEHDQIDDVQVYGLMLTAKRAFGFEFSTPHHRTMLHVGQVVDDLYDQYLDHLKGSG
jgi:hypothetical protein